MIRNVTKTSNEYDRVEVTCQSTTERDQHARTFPPDLPATHELHYEWTGEMTYAVYPRLRPALSTESETATQPDPASALRANIIKDLNAKPIADLRTLAAEMGISIGPNTTKPSLIAKIEAKLTAVPKE